jgi:hypothetical protein
VNRTSIPKGYYFGFLRWNTISAFKLASQWNEAVSLSSLGPFKLGQNVANNAARLKRAAKLMMTLVGLPMPRLFHGKRGPT